MSKFIRKWPFATLLLSTTITTTSGYILYDKYNQQKKYKSLNNDKTHSPYYYAYQKYTSKNNPLLLPIKTILPVVHLEQDLLKIKDNITENNSKTEKKGNKNDSDNDSLNQLTDLFESAKSELSNIQDQITRSILTKLPLIDDFQDLSPTELHEKMSNLWENLTINDFIDSIKDINDTDTNPELEMDAVVRYGSGLSKDEYSFIEHRKERQRLAFAKFIGVDPLEVELEDIPVVGIASSGGGMRALLGLTGYLNGMKKAGLLDCVMYMAGVSGSTWAMSIYYSSLVKCDPDAMIKYLKPHVNTHFANISRVLSLAASSPQNTKLLLQGLGQRYLQNSTVNLVDLFGTLIGSTLFTLTKEISDEDDDDVQKVIKTNNNDDATNNVNDNAKEKEKEKTSSKIKSKGKKVIELLLDKNEMKLSSQKGYFADGSQPMPIYCVVREDISVEEQTDIIENNDHDDDVKENKDDEVQEEPHMYQWFEFTSFEMGSEDISAWIPMWAFGRKFENGENVERLPEQRIDSLLGMFGSAFSASVKHFYQEIRFFLPTSVIEFTDETIGRYEKTLSTIHPISPAIYANPFYHVHSKKLTKNTASIVDSENILLMDAGVDNNIPFYPLLRKDRDVDVIIAIDLSADIQTAPHFDRAEGYVKRRKISGWPLNMGWKKRNISDTIEDMDKKTMEEIEKEDKKKCKEENIPMEENEDDKNNKENDNNNNNDTITTTSSVENNNKNIKYSLEPCTVFPATTVTKFKGNDNERLITLIYFPFICNEKYDPDFDPQTTDFCSTANFVYDSEQVNKVTKLAEVNVTQNVDQIRSVLYGVWKRKHEQRINKEELEKRANFFLYP